MLCRIMKLSKYFQDIIDDKKVNRLKDALIENFASSNETVNEVEEPGNTYITFFYILLL